MPYYYLHSNITFIILILEISRPIRPTAESRPIGKPCARLQVNDSSANTASDGARLMRVDIFALRNIQILVQWTAVRRRHRQYAVPSVLCVVLRS
jgi:hypothetical protein